MDLTLELLCRLCATPFSILSSCSFVGHYMFRAKWPSSGVPVVIVKNTCPIVLVVTSDYFGGNPRNQYNQRQLKYKKENHITVRSGILNHNNLYT
jgi:hypothetical protein